jgi:hypothetical protein
MFGRHFRWLETRAFGHHSLETDADAFDNSEKYCASDCAVPCGFVASSYGERSTGHETGRNGVPRVFLFPDSLDGAVPDAEKTAPDTKVATAETMVRML